MISPQAYIVYYTTLNGVLSIFRLLYRHIHTIKRHLVDKCDNLRKKPQYIVVRGNIRLSRKRTADIAFIFKLSVNFVASGFIIHRQCCLHRLPRRQAVLPLRLQQPQTRRPVHRRQQYRPCLRLPKYRRQKPYPQVSSYPC